MESTSKNGIGLYLFDDVVVDRVAFRVQKGGGARKITPRAFEVLLYLLEHSRRVVNKQELFDHVWGERFVTDNALSRIVKEIRQVIGDNADAPRYIETVPKRGYRFIAQLSCIEAETPPDATQTASRGSPIKEATSLNAGFPDEKEATTETLSSISLSPHQDIRFCVTADGVRLAYSIVGTGPLVVRVLGYFTHLEMEWEWPDLRYFWESLAERYTVVRYDGRGIGLSDRYTDDYTEATRQLDLDAVLTEIAAESATLLGISEGGWTAATYANLHPERISGLILYGAYCRGAQARPAYDPEEDRALITLIRKGWGRDTPAFRQILTSQFFRPEADPKLIGHFNEMQRASADPETAARYYKSLHARGDGRDLFLQVRVPTLVVHGRDDLAVSAEEGRLLAPLIPGAQLVLLPSGAHYFPTDREVVTKVVGAINRFIAQEVKQ
jgi:DNA-binding winged helix-turn-helix (wHTH) protein/pimeloyl-ACP methyl ester carboxylesterase